jgi:hypothetical protein
VERLRAALDFYANQEHLEADDYEVHTMDQADFDMHEYQHGLRARQALKEDGEA